MRIVTPDFDRMTRCGIPEVVYGRSKDEKTLKEIMGKFLSKSGRAIATKVDKKKAESISGAFAKHRLTYNDKAQTLVIKNPGFKIKKAGCVGILTAGTSDIPIAEEARIIAEELGLKTIIGYDVGVAGIHRLYPALEKMSEASSIIAVAGMEGALPSVVSGLVNVPVIGVPTSVGYGVGEGGKTALYSMLTSCSPVAVVNIDNGYGAAVFSYLIARSKDGQG